MSCLGHKSRGKSAEYESPISSEKGDKNMKAHGE